MQIIDVYLVISYQSRGTHCLRCIHYASHKRIISETLLFGFFLDQKELDDAVLGYGEIVVE